MQTITASGIRREFGGRPVLIDISLSIGSGEIFGLLGPSGAGKTTLIKILTGQLAPTGGSSALFDVDSTRLTMADRRKIGIMMDEFGLYERLTCYENLKVFADLYGLKKEDILKALDDVELRDAEKTPADKLSKGMKSRLRLARAFLTNPSVLFLDEPTSGLDPSTAEEIHELILRRRDAGCTVFLTTHNMQEAEKLCGRIALLNEGHIVESGSPAEVCRRYDHLKMIAVHLKSGEDLSLPAVPASAQRIGELIAGGELETIHSSEPSLGDVFMELTGSKLNR